MRFAQFEKATGRIIAILDMSEQNALLQCSAFHDVVSSEEADPIRHCINLETRKPVAAPLPTKPSDDHEWNSDLWRWQLRADIAERQDQRASTLRAISDLESKTLRYVGEAAVGMIDEEGSARLAALRLRIAELRKELA